MSTTPEPSTAQRLVGDIAPKLAELTDQVLFGDVWARPELAQRDRSLITVAALVTNGNTEQLLGHLRRAKQNGLTETELVEAIIHLAFYAGWPREAPARGTDQRHNTGSPRNCRTSRRPEGSQRP